MVYTSCTHGVQETGAIGLVLLQTAEILCINHMFRNRFPMRDNRMIPLSLRDQRKGVRPGLWYVHLEQVENGAIGLVLLQTAEILGLMICFAIHFLCVTIE